MHNTSGETGGRGWRLLLVTTLTCVLGLASVLYGAGARAAFPTCLGVRATQVGTTGNDTLRGTPGADVIAGRGGNDTISGLGGNDRLCGGPGDDSIGAGRGDDRIDGGGQGRDVVGGSYGDDWVTGNGSKSGGPGADRIDGLTPCGIYDGGPGNDVFRCGGDIDRCLGQITYANSPGPVNVNLTTGTATGYGRDTIDPDHYGTFCFVTGSNFQDSIVGTSTNEYLYGLGGDDTLDGLTGNPALENGLLDGGDGVDVCHNSDGSDQRVRCEAP
jgi:Ca2+-binding RTX toxin-like protein